MKENTRFKKVCLLVLHLLLKKKEYVYSQTWGGDMEKEVCVRGL